MARNAGQVVVATAQRKTKQIDETFFASGQMTTQAQQPLTVLAKSIESHGYRPAIRPQDLISFELNVATLTVFRGIAPK
jgi:hypothetical protein